VLAVPVAPPDTLATLRDECDEIVCLAAPDPFHAVGVHYTDFSQTTDADVKQFLGAARSMHSATAV
jgi:putative phosphoribosyl transferase